MKNSKSTFSTLFFFIFFSTLASSQIDSQLLRVVLIDKSVVIGFVVEENEDFMEIQTQEMGLVKFPQTGIKSVDLYNPRNSVISEEKKKIYKNQLNVTGHAIMPERGSLSLNSQMFFNSTFTYSFSKHFLIESGGSFVHDFSEADGIYPMIGAKAGISWNKYFHSALKVNYFLNETSFRSFSLYNTIGDIHNSLTLGVHKILFEVEDYNTYKISLVNTIAYSVAVSADFSEKVDLKLELLHLNKIKQLLTPTIGFNLKYFSIRAGVFFNINPDFSYYDDSETLPFIGLNIPFITPKLSSKRKTNS